MSKKTKKIKKLDFPQLIKQRLRADLGISEQQVEIVENLLRGYMPVEDSEFASQAFAPKLLEEKDAFTPPPGLTIDMENGTQQTITLTNHPLNHMYGYLTKRYGEKFGTIYWGALTSIGKPKEFYEFLGYLKKDLRFS